MALSGLSGDVYGSNWNDIRRNAFASADMDLRFLESMFFEERNLSAAIGSRDGNYTQKRVVHSSPNPTSASRTESAKANRNGRS
jgi:hypothetical protein